MRSALRILVVIPSGFVAASIAAAAMIVIAAGAEPHAGEPMIDYALKVALVSVIAAIFVGGIAAVPAIIAIIFAEILRLRSLLPYLIIGGAIGLLAFLSGIGGGSAATHDLEIGAAAGVVGGLVYWLIAGRRAGFGPAEPPPVSSDPTAG